MRQTQIIVRVMSIAQAFDAQGMDDGYDLTVSTLEQLQFMQNRVAMPDHRHLHLHVREAPNVGDYLCCSVNLASDEQKRKAHAERLKQQLIPTRQEYPTAFGPPRRSVSTQVDEMALQVTLEQAELGELQLHRDRMAELLKKIEQRIKKLGGE